MTVLIFGHTGSLGRAINSQPLGFRTLLSARDCMFMSPYDLGSTLVNHKADAVINCAAMTGMDKCYKQPESAKIINTDWPHKLAAACKSAQVPLLHFSTEAVFPCDRDGPSAERAEPAPTTAYGRGKLAGEPPPPCTVARLPLLYGPTCGNQIVAKLLRQILRGENVRIATDIYSTPMYAPDVAEWACDWVEAQAIPADRCPPLVHLASDQIIGLYDLVRAIKRALGDTGTTHGHLVAALAEEFPSAEPKPLHGGLKSNYIAPWSLDAGVMKYAAWINENWEQFMGETNDGRVLSHATEGI